MSYKLMKSHVCEKNIGAIPKFNENIFLKINTTRFLKQLDNIYFIFQVYCKNIISPNVSILFVSN